MGAILKSVCILLLTTHLESAEEISGNDSQRHHELVPMKIFLSSFVENVNKTFEKLENNVASLKVQLENPNRSLPILMEPPGNSFFE